MIIEQRNNNLRLLERSILYTCMRYMLYILYIHEKDEALRQQTSQSALNIHKYIEGAYE